MGRTVVELDLKVVKGTASEMETRRLDKLMKISVPPGVESRFDMGLWYSGATVGILSKSPSIFQLGIYSLIQGYQKKEVYFHTSKRLFAILQKFLNFI